MNESFLGTAAPWTSDVTLVLEVGMGAALGFGMMLARRRRYIAHAWCQSIVVLLNPAAVFLTMIPSFRRSFDPSMAADLRDSYYWLAAVHGGVGALAELFALYVLMVAGTTLLPRRLRFVRYKVWMRAALGLWWTTLLLGVGTYVRWYVVPLWAK